MLARCRLHYFSVLFFSLLFGSMALPVFLSAQTSLQELVQGLKQQTAGKILILRSFDAQATVHARLDAGLIVLSPTRFKTFAMVKIDFVSLNGQHIVVTGTRSYLLRRNATQLVPLAETEPVTLDIDFTSAPQPPTLAKITSALFFPDVASALAAIPAAVSHLAPLAITPPEPASQVSRDCDCAQAGSPTCTVPGKQKGLVPPALTRSVDPEMPFGTPRGVQLLAVTALEVGADGKVGDLWILRASSAAIASAAVAATRQYLFKPATCHGTPVPYYVRSDVHFTTG